MQAVNFAEEVYCPQCGEVHRVTDFITRTVWCSLCSQDMKFLPDKSGTWSKKPSGLKVNQVKE